MHVDFGILAHMELERFQKPLRVSKPNFSFSELFREC